LRGLGLTEAEYRLIREDLTPESRCFLIKQGNTSIVAKLDLGGMKDELSVLSGRAETLAVMEAAIARAGQIPPPGSHCSMPMRGEAEMKVAPVMSLVIAPIAFALPSPPASAQGIPVYDSSNYLQALSTVSNTLKMVQQGETAIATANTQLQSLQKLTNVNSVATSLIAPRCEISCPPPRWTPTPCWRAT
jgi:hypothetical protein